jgi:tRNA dimethylallyltransferase
MFDRGLVDEIKRLLQRGFNWDHPGMRGIGYREFYQFQRGCMSIGDLKKLIMRNTRRYAKRQITFFKTLPSVHWYHPEELGSLRSEIDFFFGKCSIDD